MTVKARSQATIDRLEGQLRELKRKVGLYTSRLKVAQLEITPLKNTIPDIEDQSSLSLPLPRDCIFHDLVKNRQIPVNPRRYSTETLTWAEWL